MRGESTTNWTCASCTAEVPVDFVVCWSCGTTRGGKRDPAFRRVEEFDASADGDAAEEVEPAQFGLRSMFVVVTVSAVALAASSRTSFAGRFERLFVFGAFLLVTAAVFAAINSIVGRVFGPAGQAVTMIVVMFIALAAAREIFSLP